MKIALCLLVLLPLVYCASIDERFLFSLSEAVSKLQAALGSDTSEAACEAGCPSLLGSFVGSLLCGPACKELQKLAG